MAARFVPLLRIWLRRSSSFGAARVVSPPALVAPLWRTLSLRTRASKHRGGGIHSLPSLSPHHRWEPQHDRAAPASLLSKPSSSSSSRSLSSVHRNRPAARLPLPRVCILNQRSFFLPWAEARQHVRTLNAFCFSFCLQLPGALPAAARLRGCRPCARAGPACGGGRAHRFELLAPLQLADGVILLLQLLANSVGRQTCGAAPCSQDGRNECVAAAREGSAPLATGVEKSRFTGSM